MAEIIVEGRGLSKAFGANVVLKDVSIRCEAGKAIALVGENGAGKSTLMNILSGVLPPTAGSVLVDGKAVRFTSPEQARKMASLSDGAIVGSAIVKLIAQYGREAVPYVADYVKRMKDAVRQA